MFRDATGAIQPGHIAIVIGVFAYLLWAAPILVSGTGGRVSIRSLKPRQVWDYQRGQTALRHATRSLVVAGALAFVIQSFIG